MSFGQLSKWLEQSTDLQLMISLPKRPYSDCDNPSKIKQGDLYLKKNLFIILVSVKRQCIKSE
jgi:hypothetical protein